MLKPRLGPRFLLRIGAPTPFRGLSMVRLALCCGFREQPIRFRTATAAGIGRLTRNQGREKLAALVRNNVEALLAALRYCAGHGIGGFRVNSRILPLATHPAHGYDLTDLPGSEEITRHFEQCRAFARAHALRLTLHPDQYVVLNSPRPEVVADSLRELEFQADLAARVGADVVTVHGGGGFGDRGQALAAFARNADRLSSQARAVLTVENDDRTYTPADLLPLCRATGIPLVYDVHHHRCHGDGLTVEAATDLAAATWAREPVVHISSPLEGWNGPRPERHHDYIDAADFPNDWRSRNLTVEVEAKAKELAVLRLRTDLAASAAGLH